MKLTDISGRRTGMVICPACGCPLQRTMAGTLVDGLHRHYEVIHPALATPLEAQVIGA